MLKNMFKSWWAVSVAYAIALGILIFGPVLGEVRLFWLAVGLFTIWDGLWIFSGTIDRNAQEMLDSSTRARTYMSYFIAIYSAALIFFFFRLPDGEQKTIVDLFSKAEIPIWLLPVPLAMCGMAILFFPIQIGDVISKNLNDGKPSKANIAVTVINVWVQKVSTFAFIFAILMIFSVIEKKAPVQTLPDPTKKITTVPFTPIGEGKLEKTNP